MQSHIFRRTIRAVLAVSSLSLLAGAACAAGNSKLSGLDFNTIDANHDGYIDSKEAAAVPELAAILKSADKDRDGKLSESEYSAAVGVSGNTQGSGQSGQGSGQGGY